MIKIFVITIIIISVNSCGTKKILSQEDFSKTKENILEDINETKRIEEVKKHYYKMFVVLDSISKSVPNFFSTKIDVKYSDNEKKLAFKSSLKIKKDSAVNALFTYSGIPIIAAMVTTDSVKISNKREKCYLLENINFIEELLGFNFGFYDLNNILQKRKNSIYFNLEEILLGRPFFFQRYADEPFIDINLCINTLYDPESSKQKNIFYYAENFENDYIEFTYYLTDDLKHIMKEEVYSNQKQTKINVEYSEYYNDSIFSAPKNIEIKIKSPKNEILLSLLYEKIEINIPKEMPIVIPDTYEKCK